MKIYHIKDYGKEATIKHNFNSHLKKQLKSVDIFLSYIKDKLPDKYEMVRNKFLTLLSESSKLDKVPKEVNIDSKGLNMLSSDQKLVSVYTLAYLSLTEYQKYKPGDKEIAILACDYLRGVLYQEFKG